MSLGWTPDDRPSPPPLGLWERPLTEDAYRVAEGFTVAGQNYNLACAHGHRWWSPAPESFAGSRCRASAVRTRDGLPDGRTTCELALCRTDYGA